MIEQTITVNNVRDLRKGDLVVDAPARSLLNKTVESVKARAKRATVFHTLGRADTDVESTWVVQRMVKTDEEKAAERNEFLEASLRSRRAASAAQLAKIREKFATMMAAGQMASHWDFTALADAQAQEDLWARVDMVESREGEQRSFLEIVELVRERCREDLLSFRAASRSTSTMANAVEDAQLNAKQEFISRWI